jgi:murein DD-endopeptidase MepM/ murein hydrolase activator NlpD
MATYGDFVYPLGLPEKGQISSTPAQHQQRAFGNCQSDRAADVSTPLGTPVYAVTDGTLSPRGLGFGYNDGSVEPKKKGWRVHRSTMEAT